MVFYLKNTTGIILSLIILNDSSLDYGNKKVRKEQNFGRLYFMTFKVKSNPCHLFSSQIYLYLFQ
jgi:hypothetical protein